MPDGKDSKSFWEKLLNLSGYFACGVVGLLAGLVLTNQLYRPGCNLKVSKSGVETSCPGINDVPLSFGEGPSSRSLKSALLIVQERTSGAGSARIYIDNEVLDAKFSETSVVPPSGSRSSLEVVYQLLESAKASDKAHICLATGPSKGFRLQLKK